MRPVPQLTKEEQVQKEKQVKIGEQRIDQFLRKRMGVQDRAPMIPQKVQTSEMQQLNMLGQDESSLKKQDLPSESDDDLEFEGSAPFKSIKELIGKKQNFE